MPEVSVHDNSSNGTQVTYLMQQPINCGADECTLASQFIYYETGQKLDCCTMGQFTAVSFMHVYDISPL